MILPLIFKGGVGCSEVEFVNEKISSAFTTVPVIISSAITAL